jgi:flagellar hook assembly protein FlgD
LQYQRNRNHRSREVFARERLQRDTRRLQVYDLRLTRHKAIQKGYGQTQIRYYLPASVNKAQLRIMDINGRLMKLLDLQGTGEGQVNLNTNDLSSGSYQYSLVLDGQLFTSKQMVLTKME